jgi:CheY-like chemotaxis protein
MTNDVASASSAASDPDVEALTVLVVDDDPSILEGLADLLEFEGFDVVTAMDGQAALSQLRSGLRPAVILLDLMMPGMNGWDFRAEQVKDDELKDIAVVVMTAANVTEGALRAQLGDIELVRKPLSHDGLLRALRRGCGEAVH